MSRRFARLPAVAALLVAVAATAAGCSPARSTVTITIHYSGFDTDRVPACPGGVPVTFVLVNEDPIDHEWLIGDEAFHEKHRDRHARGARGRCRPR